MKDDVPAHFTDPDALRLAIHNIDFAEMAALHDALNAAAQSLLGFMNQPRVGPTAREILESYEHHFHRLASVIAETAAGKIAKTTDDLELRTAIFLKEQASTEFVWSDVIGRALEVLSARTRVHFTIEEDRR